MSCETLKLYIEHIAIKFDESRSNEKLTEHYENEIQKHEFSVSGKEIFCVG